MPSERKMAATLLIPLMAATWSGMRYAVGGESLTISRVAIPVKQEQTPGCATLSEDGRSIAFHMQSKDGHGKLDIWFSRLQNGHWSDPVNAGPQINTDANEFDAKFTPDGATMLFERTNDFNKYTEVMVTHFRNGSWSPAKKIGPPITLPGTRQFCVLPARDGKRIYFSSDRSGGLGGLDFYYSNRIGNDWTQWSEPVNLGPGINTKGDEGDLTVSRDERLIIFNAKREDSIAGSTDFYLSRKVNDQWTAPVNLGPRINTPGTEYCAWLGYDGQTLYINTNWNDLIAPREDTDSSIWMFRLSEGFH